MTTFPSLQDRFRGCLLGGAVGDALGAPVEFSTRNEIMSRFGPAGITDYAPAYGRRGAITDDTQMTLFTAEGFIRAAVRFANRGICHPPSVIHRAYLRWLRTQDRTPSIEVAMDGWLSGIQELRAQRAPGNTCISALESATQLGERAGNESKGCGTVMRVAPIGLACSQDRVFQMGVETALLTHGHPTALACTGFLATLLNRLTIGQSLFDGVHASLDELKRYPKHQEAITAVNLALDLASNGAPNAHAVERLGAGWIAEEAVAISVYCALVGKSFEDAICLAVNHSGDSDSTGAITGNLWGATHGIDSIPSKWLAELELQQEITRVADDLLGVNRGSIDLESKATWERYPGY